MNITIDDTSPNFVWSTGADNWKGQAPNQVAINNNYFLQTYHATQSKGSNVAITFVGQFPALVLRRSHLLKILPTVIQVQQSRSMVQRVCTFFNIVKRGSMREGARP